MPYPSKSKVAITITLFTPSQLIRDTASFIWSTLTFICMTCCVARQLWRENWREWTCMREQGKKWLTEIPKIKYCGSCCCNSIANPGSPWGYSVHLHWISWVTVTYYKDVLWCVPHKCPHHHTLFLSLHSPPTPGPRTPQPTAMSCCMPSCSHEQQLSEKWIQKQQSIKTETAVTILHGMVLISGYILHTHAFFFSFLLPFPSIRISYGIVEKQSLGRGQCRRAVLLTDFVIWKLVLLRHLFCCFF